MPKFFWVNIGHVRGTGKTEAAAVLVVRNRDASERLLSSGDGAFRDTAKMCKTIAFWALLTGLEPLRFGKLACNLKGSLSGP